MLQHTLVVVIPAGFCQIGRVHILEARYLPVAATECDKFEDMSTPLLSVKVFCENNLDVLFKQDTVTVTNEVGSTHNGTKNIANQVNIHHLALGSPTHATFLQAILFRWRVGKWHVLGILMLGDAC